MSKKDVQALQQFRKDLQGKVSVKSKAAAKVAKTAKGQRAAVAREKQAVMPVRVEERLAWSFPVSEAQWLVSFADASSAITGKSLYEAVASSRELAFETARLRAAYLAYERGVWSAPVRFDEAGSFAKVVKTQIARERQGGADLGLLGYSADDIAEMAVYNAWVRKVVHYLTQIGADKDSMTVLSRALRDRRSDAELRADAQLGAKERIVVEQDSTAALGVRVRHQEHTSAVAKARQYLAARRMFKASKFDVDCTPSIGEVYRELKGVLYEGIRAFSKNLEGLTQEGIITDQVFYRKVVSTGFVKIDDALFTEYVFNEQELRREAVIDVLVNNAASLTPAEVDSLVVLKALNEGMSLLEIREAMDLSQRAFNQAVSGAKHVVELADARKVDARIAQLKAELIAA